MPKLLQRSTGRAQSLVRITIDPDMDYHDESSPSHDCGMEYYAPTLSTPGTAPNNYPGSNNSSMRDILEHVSEMTLECPLRNEDEVGDNCFRMRAQTPIAWGAPPPAPLPAAVSSRKVPGLFFTPEQCGRKSFGSPPLGVARIRAPPTGNLVYQQQQPPQPRNHHLVLQNAPLLPTSPDMSMEGPSNLPPPYFSPVGTGMTVRIPLPPQTFPDYVDVQDSLYKQQQQPPQLQAEYHVHRPEFHNHHVGVNEPHENLMPPEMPMIPSPMSLSHKEMGRTLKMRRVQTNSFYRSLSPD